MEESSNFTYHNPRLRDGEPDEVAGFAATQALQVAQLLSRALNDAWVLARNAALTEHIKEHGSAPEDADEWFKQRAEAKALLQANRYFGEAVRKLNAVERSLTFDPDAELPDE